MSNLPNVYTDEDRDHVNLLSLDPDSLQAGFVYRWVNANPARVARMRLHGWTMVTEQDLARPLADVDNAADGTYRVGDAILMKCPEEASIRRKNRRLQRAAARTANRPEEVKAQIERLKETVGSQYAAGISTELITGAETL